MNILLVEDDIDLHDTVKEFLEQFYTMHSAYNGEEVISLVYENRYDLILLDIKLPKLNGIEVTKTIRDNHDNIPIIFLTSFDTQQDIENGFLVGGDDYVTKPFSLKELRLRIEAIFKRVYGITNKIKLQSNVTFDLINDELIIDDKPIHLKPKEIKLLKFFLQNKNKPLSKDVILNNIYDYNEDGNEQSLRVFVNRLRNILGKKIVTIKNLGYKFVC